MGALLSLIVITAGAILFVVNGFENIKDIMKGD